MSVYSGVNALVGFDVATHSCLWGVECDCVPEYLLMKNCYTYILMCMEIMRKAMLEDDLPCDVPKTTISNSFAQQCYKASCRLQWLEPKYM